ncbi:MAG: DUF3592 domain-containing protein [Acetobacteraceae bacterium]|nr:DUF3592 domain-containing protein [Acetobacteraceae bacterium]
MSAATQTPSQQQPARTRGLGIFLMLIGLVLAYGAYSQVSEVWGLAARGVQVEATVVGMETHRSRRGSASYYPIFRFATADGRTMQATSSTAVTPSDFPRGRRATVVYDPADPTRLRLPSDVASGPGITPWVLAFFAVLLLLGGVLLFRGPRHAAPVPPARP